MKDKFESYIQKVYRDIQSLKKGNDDIFTIQTSSRMISRKLRLLNRILILIHEKRLLFISNLMKQADLLDSESTYHIKLELSARRHNSKEKHRDKLEECPICYNKFRSKKMTKTDCNHTFCRRCIKRSLENCPECPLCRVTIAADATEDSISE